MNNPLNLLAFDMGASNGRGILGKFDGKKIIMEELHRFENNYIDVNGVLYWDIFHLFQQLKNSLTCFKTGGHGDLASFGVDTWGVDYGLLDKNGQLLGNPRSYRHCTDQDMERAWQTVDFPTLFGRTGIGPFSYNTLYQLYRRKLDGDPALELADTMLFTPDLLGYFLSGEKAVEYSITTTSGMYNATERRWDLETMEALGLPTNILPNIDFAGTVRGELRSSIATELGINRAKLCAVGGHDTASAVAAIPGTGNFAFCSSGTWSLFGVETETAILTDSVRNSGFSNEGTVQGTFRPLANMMGLWLIQECRNQWKKAGNAYS
ncbi:MAG: FGGY family carbohydrate kinase, partial [Eubacteriales bacterium]